MKTSLSVVDRGPPPACPAPFNLAEYVLSAGRRTPKKVALAIVGPARAQRWQYDRLEAAVLGAGAALLDEGLQPGDRVLLRLGNAASFPIAFLGSIAAGLVPIPASARLTEREIAAVAATTDPKVVVASPGISRPEGLPVLSEERLLDAKTPLTCYAMGDPNRLAYIVLTSGSSGRPRPVAHAHRAVWARRLMWSDWYGLTPDDRLLHAGAMNWTYTLGTGLLDPWAIGATALVPSEGVPIEALPLLLRRHDATLFAAAPGVYRKMLRGMAQQSESPAPPLPRLRHALSAGERLPETVRSGWRQATGTQIHEAYGQSECSTFISGSPGRTLPQGATGYVQAGRKVGILDADGTLVPSGTPGHLAVATSDPGLMLGTLNTDGSLSPPKGDWHATGDTASMGADGAITILGRREDIMNAGGYRVLPAEIEDALTDHPLVTEAAAVEIEIKPDTYIIALAYCTNAPLDPEDLSRFADKSLADYKRPKLYRLVQDLPRGGNGKLQRAQVRALFEDHHDPA